MPIIETFEPHPDAQAHPDEPRCPECGQLLVVGTIWQHRLQHWGDEIPNHVKYDGARWRYNALRDVAERFE